MGEYEMRSPVSFLKRAATVHGERRSVVYGNVVFNWSQTYQRCLNLASSLVHHLHISPGEVVAAFAPNIPELYELHFAVPMAGAIISPLNTNLNATTLSLLLHQLNPKLIFVDSQFLHLILTASHLLNTTIILIPQNPHSHQTTFLTYNDLLSMAAEKFPPKILNESDPVSVNWTSGSTGLHKGVVYTHKATYINSMAMIRRSKIFKRSVFLWTVDMFRCNGWCFIWAVAAVGGCNICLRSFTGDAIFSGVKLHEVTLLCGPPIILKMIAESSESRRKMVRRVDVIVAGVLPVREIMEKVTEVGFDVSYGYGMTEVLGPAIVRPWKVDCDNCLSVTDLMPLCEDGEDVSTLEVDVKDPSSMESVPEDGETLGEIMFRGNTLMSGYFKNPEATRKAFLGGWFRTGDLAIRRPRGFIQMKDRAKDIIISTSRAAVSSVEVEAVLMSHPKVAEAAVVGLEEKPWGFVKLKKGFFANADEIIEFCRDYLPEFMVPKGVVFGDLPTNSTGKVQKFVLREKMKAMNGNHATLTT